MAAAINPHTPGVLFASPAAMGMRSGSSRKGGGGVQCWCCGFVCCWLR